ncbi:MAG: polysaccharide deacetylase family protein [Promethearchaeota archaeon]
MVKKMKNVVSVDVEQWFHRRVFREHVRDTDVYPKKSRHVVEATKKVLEIFNKYDKTTTFFILGEVAELLPELVKEIAEGGHEVAFHGYSHVGLHEVGRNEFEKGVEKGVDRLYQISKQKVRGFRAPDFSLNNKTIWALKVINDNGFKYDSSLFPTITPQYGVHAGICHPYFPSLSDLTKEDPNQKIIEFPMLVRRVGVFRIPVAGGFYLRLFGPRFILEGMRNMNKQGYPAMCYVHPWEVYGFPQINMPVHKKLYAYYKVPCLRIFEKLVRNTDVAPAIEVLETIGI